MIVQSCNVGRIQLVQTMLLLHNSFITNKSVTSWCTLPCCGVPVGVFSLGSLTHQRIPPSTCHDHVFTVNYRSLLQVVVNCLKYSSAVSETSNLTSKCCLFDVLLRHILCSWVNFIFLGDSLDGSLYL